MAALLFFANRAKGFRHSAILSVSLALAFLAAWDVLGMAFFPGLLKDLVVPSGAFFFAQAKVFGFLLILYLIGGTLARLISRISQPDSTKRDQNC